MGRINARAKLLLIQMLWGAGKLMQPSYRKLGEGFEAWAYRSGLLKQIRRLEELGYLEVGRGEYDGDRVHRLTEAGRTVALGGRDPEVCWARPWDGKWRLILFDIPESERSDRRKLTRALAAMGCGCLQGSVWISPVRPPGAKAALGEDGGDCSHLIVLEAESRGAGVDRRMVVAAWDFEKINARYQRHQEVLKEVPASAPETTPQALMQWGARENQARLAAVRNDPLLPAKLLPGGYLGKKAWRERSKVLREAGRVAKAVLASGG